MTPDTWQSRIFTPQTSPAANNTQEEEITLYRLVIRGPRNSTPAESLLPPSHIPFLAAGAGSHTIITASPALRCAIYEAIIYYSGDQATLRLLDGTLDLMGPLTMLQSGMGLLLPWCDHPYFVLQPGNAFCMELSDLAGTGQVSGFYKYRMLESYAG